MTAVLGVALPMAAIAATPASAAPAALAPADDGVLKVLLFYTNDNVHASVPNTRAAVREMATALGQEYGQTVDIQETNQANVFTPENLATKDLLVFAHTAGVLFNTDQRAALESYIRGGGGYVGLHYTAWSPDQTEADVNPFYRRLVGASATGHPEPAGGQRGTVSVTDPSSPLTAGLQSPLSYQDEWYEWDVNPTQNVKTLVTIDESSLPNGIVGQEGTTHPVTWCQKIDSGRSWYSSLGHWPSAWTAADDGANPNDNQADDFVRGQLRFGMAYSAGLLPADCSPPAKDEQGSFSGVTPWPLMPINAALTADGKVQSFGSVGSGCTDPNPYDYSGNDCVTQGGQTQIDVWDPSVVRTVGNLVSGVIPNATYTDLFCSMQVQMPHRRSTFTVGGDDSLGGNAPNDAAIGVTSYSTGKGLANEAPMNFPRWYPTGTTLPNGSIVVQGGSLRGGPGGPGVLTPEVYDPSQGNSWKLLTGATSSLAYGDAQNGQPDENRWWYPRAFVAPTNGNVFNISGTQMTELDTAANDGLGAIIDRGRLGNGTGNQGANGNPVGATSTATMYRPGKILQVGGGYWANGGGPAGAKAGFTVDITGGTANPVVTATDPMKYGRHWASSVVMPDGKVLITGGSRDNNGQGGYVTNPEIWNPDAPSGQQWTTVQIPYEHARLYHSISLLLPDGRVMIGGGGAPGPHNYTDVEYYSPAYLFDGNSPAERPVVTNAPKKIGYNGQFSLTSSKTVDRVTLVRNGSVTHGFNNDQNFQDLAFTTNGNTVNITSPANANYAPPGAYMVFVWSNGTPSVAKIVQIDPTTKMNAPAPKVVDQFEYPRLPASWQSGTYDSVEVPAGNSRMSPWVVNKGVQLIRAIDGSMRGNGDTGYHLALRADGDLTRTLKGLDVGKEYRVSVRYARDSRSSGTAPATASLTIAGLDATLTATSAKPSTAAFDTYVGTFTATARQQDLRIVAGGTGGNLVLDDLVVVGTGLGVDDAQVKYSFDEGTGTTAANTGSDITVGDATLVGTTGWTPDGITGGALDMPGGSNANTVDLPDNLLQNENTFTTSFWARPDTKGNWINLFHIGSGLGDAGSFFQIQMQTQAQGNTGLAATFKKKGSNLQERVYATPTKDVTANQWNHVVFTRQGATGTLYLNGQQVAQRTDLTLTMTDIGATENNWLGRNGYPDPSFDGRMDDVRLWTTALSAADVAGLYADGSALNTTTTVSTSPASPSEFNAPITVSATVKDSANANPTGVAELWVDGASQGGQVTVTNGQVSFPPVTLAPRQHAIEVRFIAAAGWRDSVGTAQHTVSRPPVGEGVPVHYKFDEGTGTTAANSGSDPSIGDATFVGDASWSTTGKYGGAVRLGSAGHVRLPDNITEGMDDEVTISTWIRPTVLPNWTTHAQVGKGQNEFLLLQSEWNSGQGGFAVTIRNDNGTQYRTVLRGTKDLQLGEWTHVAVTVGLNQGGTSSTVKIYFNGVLQDTDIYHDGALQQNATSIPVVMKQLNEGGTNANFIGNGSWPDPRPTEQVDDFRIYGYALSAEDVLAVYNGTTNAAPVGVADDYDTATGQVLEVSAEDGVLANDTDADGDDLTVALEADDDLAQPGNGFVEMSADGSFSYTPDEGFTGEDTFTYRAFDGESKSQPTTVTITVADAPNTAPVAVDDEFTTVSGEALTLAAPGVLGNDTDADGDTLTAQRTSQPVNGSVTVNANGSFTYTPDAGFVGKDQFTYTANDGTVTSAPATVTITVKPKGGGSGGDSGPLNSAVAGASAPFTYGQAGSLVVSVAPAAATGKVEVLDGASVVASGTLASGQARLALPATSLLPGTHQLTLRYAGDGGHKASSSTVEVVVDKVVPRMTVKAPSKVKKGKAAKVTVVLRAADDVPVTGTVSVAVKGGKTVTGTLKDGKVVIKLPKASKKKSKLTVTYSGSNLAESVSDKVTIKVRKRR